MMIIAVAVSACGSVDTAGPVVAESPHGPMELAGLKHAGEMRLREYARDMLQPDVQEILIGRVKTKYVVALGQLVLRSDGEADLTLVEIVPPLAPVGRSRVVYYTCKTDASKFLAAVREFARTNPPTSATTRQRKTSWVELHASRASSSYREGSRSGENASLDRWLKVLRRRLLSEPRNVKRPEPVE